MDELISRKAAIDAIWTHATRVLENSDYDIFIQDIYKMTHRHIAELIQHLPSAQPERKTGRWEDINKNYYCRISGRCSACGWEAHLYEDDVVGMPYCPNCGAKMEG